MAVYFNLGVLFLSPARSSSSIYFFVWQWIPPNFSFYLYDYVFIGRDAYVGASSDAVQLSATRVDVGFSLTLGNSYTQNTLVPRPRQQGWRKYYITTKEIGWILLCVKTN